MAKSFAQSKGARGEREVIALLQPMLNLVYSKTNLEIPKLQRNSLQSDGGGFDIVGISWMALEVKRCETLNLNAWYHQCIKQAGPNQTPILMYKQNHGKWRIRMHSLLITGGSSNLKVWSEIDLNSFLLYFKMRLEAELNCG